jgi:hypothetical protein
MHTIRPRSRQPARTGPKKWSRVQGTVYGIRCMDAKGRRTLIMGHPKSDVGYVGMYSGWWRERIRQHLYGGGRHHCKPQLWRMLVPGFDDNAMNAVTRKQQLAVVDRLIREGTVFIIWQKRGLRWNAKRCFYWKQMQQKRQRFWNPMRGFYWKHMRTFYWWVKLRESWAIFKLRPVHNILENTDNPHHIPKWELERLLEQRERTAAIEPRSAVNDRWTGFRTNADGSVTWFGPEAATEFAEFNRRRVE